MGVTPSVGDADARWMTHALDLAKRALGQDEVPVGAVLVLNDEPLSEGWNRPIGTHDPTAHAEICALRAAGEKAGNYRLSGTTLYVTLEPCLMCVGAMIHARIARLVYGAADVRNAKGSGVRCWMQSGRHNHHIEVTGGVLDKESGDLLRAFFWGRRSARHSWS